jgi:hypothetical protein
VIIQLDGVGIALILPGNKHPSLNHINLLQKLGMNIVFNFQLRLDCGQSSVSVARIVGIALKWWGVS